ncbi:MAG: transcription-repair coupling factor [Vicinamibacterales bacterium]
MSSSLVFRSLLRSTVARTGLGAHARAIDGLTPPAKALAVAAEASASPKDLLLFVVPADTDIDAATTDIRFFLAAVESEAESVAERAVLPFPSEQVDPYRGLAPHFRVSSLRARALAAAALGEARVIVASAQALMPRLPAPENIAAATIALRPGEDIEPARLAEILVDGGYERQDPVDEHGEFCLRGGILDVFPAGDPLPVRVEFIGDTIESIRRFDPSSQRSVETLDQFQVVPVRERAEAGTAAVAGSAAPPATVFDYLRASRRPRLIVSEPEEVRAQVDRWWEQVSASYEERVAGGRSESAAVPQAPPDALLLSWEALEGQLAPAATLEALAVADENSGRPAPRHVATQPTSEFRGRIPEWIADVRQARDRGDTVAFVASSHGRADRTVELLRDYEIRALQARQGDDITAGAVLVVEGTLSKGLRLRYTEHTEGTDHTEGTEHTEGEGDTGGRPGGGALTIYAEGDVFEDERRGQAGKARRRSAAAAFLSDLRDLKVGDLIVHVDHGIGQFVGLKQIAVSGDLVQEFLELRYHGDNKLFVPVERLDLVQKYTGGSRPPLDKLGGTSWEKAKKKVKKAMRDMAEELLKLYAARRAVPGHAFAADTHWQEEFEDAFQWDLTADQATAVADIKRDMESTLPMDRLLCGDVGYGKTEVAMRAAFKAVMDGKQVAVLAPTTVLAFQHLETLRRRFAAFPARIDMVSRFRTRQEIKETLDALANGRLDVIVGTHRLLSKDVQFRDLGLLIVDEEQRFGVAHKERIKQMRKRVDVLTMTATPIPRTLNMSLVGIRDMSVIETPPKDRLAIQTNVVKFDAKVITRAITQELARGGQVFFVHNRVESIYSMGNLLQRLIPEARIVIGHGQMGEDALERAMLDFMAHRYDILLATTIVENGLDIPNANTIIINRADRYGLSQLYQLRGRVGRSDRAAYAYLLIPPEEALSPVAKKRLAAIREFSDLGSGFRVAALDLEIRGAGNFLGGEQSGHIDAVGFEMYMKLLEDTIRELKGEDLEDDVRATVNLRIDFRIPDEYVPDVNQRLMIYRRIASARTEADLEQVMEEVRDRYGPPSLAVLNLADYGRIRVMADALAVESLDREGSTVVVRFREKTPVDPVRLIHLVRDRDDLQIVPPVSLKLSLAGPAAPPAATPAPGGGGREGLAAHRGRFRATRPRREPAWWTARATAGEVTAGFSKAEILKPKSEDPRAPGGILDRVTELLEELAPEA